MMKKDKIKYIQKYVGIPRTKPKYSTVNHPKGEIPSPPTVALLKETTLSTAIDDCKVLGPEVHDKERDNSLVFCPSEERKYENHVVMFPISGTHAKETETMGPYHDHEVEDIDGVWLDFDNDMSNGLMDSNGNILTLNDKGINENPDHQNVVETAHVEEKDSTGFVVCANKMAMAASDQDLESVNNSTTSNGGSGECYSCCSMASGFDDRLDIWELEGVVQGNGISDQKESMLSWLWESDNLEGDSSTLADIDPDKQDAMVAWLLS